MKLTESSRSFSDQKVFLTVLTTEKYVPGVLALKRSLLRVGSKHRLVILLPESQSLVLQEALLAKGVLDSFCSVLIKPDVVIDPPDGVVVDKKHYWFNTFFKLRAADCTEYKKIILIDCDMLVLCNLDELFEKPNYSAVIAGKTVYPHWVDLNSGLMVLVPDKTFYANLYESIGPTMMFRQQEGLAVSDQDVFAWTFPEWRTRQELHLSEKYNCFYEHAHILHRGGAQSHSFYWCEQAMV